MSSTEAKKLDATAQVADSAVAASEAPTGAQEAVLVVSESMPDGAVTVEGYDFNEGVDYHKLLQVIM